MSRRSLPRAGCGGFFLLPAYPETLNLLRVQNQPLYDVPGRTQSPYLTRTLFAVAPTEAVAFLHSAA